MSHFSHNDYITIIIIQVVIVMQINILQFIEL